jgi:hypothetical protein
MAAAFSAIQGFLCVDKVVPSNNSDVEESDPNPLSANLLLWTVRKISVQYWLVHSEC